MRHRILFLIARIVATLAEHRECHFGLGHEIVRFLEKFVVIDLLDLDVLGMVLLRRDELSRRLGALKLIENVEGWVANSIIGFLQLNSQVNLIGSTIGALSDDSLCLLVLYHVLDAQLYLPV